MSDDAAQGPKWWREIRSAVCAEYAQQMQPEGLVIAYDAEALRRLLQIPVGSGTEIEVSAEGYAPLWFPITKLGPERFRIGRPRQGGTK